MAADPIGGAFRLALPAVAWIWPTPDFCGGMAVVALCWFAWAVARTVRDVMREVS